MNIHIAITHLRSKLLQMHLNSPFELLTVHIWILFPAFEGFPGSSVGKESACNAGDPGLISGFGISIGEEIGYPLQYSWASLVAQLVKNLPAMGEYLGSIPGLGRSPGEGEGYPLQYSGLGRRVGHDWATFTFTFHFLELKNLKNLNITKCIKIIKESAQGTIINIL